MSSTKAPRKQSTAATNTARNPTSPTAPDGAPASGARGKEVWNLRLYVAGDSPKSRSAIDNLKKLCALHLDGAFELEVVDLRQRPELAKADQILAVPTLVRKIPEPMKRVIGDLSDAERALVALDIDARN